MSFTYLAGPYHHTDATVRHQRLIAHCRAAAYLMKKGEVVFSPIAHSHPIDEVMYGASNHAFWMRQDLPMLALANKLVVLTLDGWKGSRGTTQEIARAEKLKKVIEYMQPITRELLEDMK